MPYLSDFFEDDPNAFRNRQEAEGLPTLSSFIRSFLPDPQFGPELPPEMKRQREAQQAAEYFGGFQGEPVPLAQPETPPDLSNYNISNMAEKQKLDYNASRGGIDAPVEAPTLASVYDAQRQKEGWTSVPGTSSFSQPGASGAYRVESGTTPEGRRATAAADSLRSYNKAKYGGSGRYGGAGAEVLNPSETIAELGRAAYAAGAGKRAKDQAALAALESQLQNALMAGGGGTQALGDLRSRIGELTKMIGGDQKLADTNLMASAGTAEELLKPVTAMQEKERERPDYGMLAALLGGGKNPGQMNKATYDLYGNALKSQREERRLDNADRSFNRLMQNDQYTRDNPNMTQPSAARVKQNVEAILGAQGYRLGRVAGSDYVFKGNSSTPEKNSAQLIAQAFQQAQQQMTPQRGNPAVTQNPAVKAVVEMMKAEQSGTLAPHQAPLLQRYKQNVIAMQKEFMSKGMDQQTAAEQATIIAAGSITGMR